MSITPYSIDRNIFRQGNSFYNIFYNINRVIEVMKVNAVPEKIIKEYVAKLVRGGDFIETTKEYVSTFESAPEPD